MKIKKRRIFITGAASFIGVNLISALQREGWEIYALIYKKNIPQNLITGKTHIIKGDIECPETFFKIIDKVDVMCHLAAYIPQDHNDFTEAEKCMKINALATLKLAEYASRRLKGRFIYISSGNAYQEQKKPSVEEDPLFPSSRAPYYLVSKLTGGIYVEHFRRFKKLDAVILRVSSVYGIGMKEQSVIPSWMRNSFLGKPLEIWGDGSSTYDYVYVDNVVQAIQAALEQGESGIYNIGSGKANSLSDLAKIFIKIFNEKKIEIKLKQTKTETHSVKFPTLAVTKAHKMWNYNPLSLEEGLLEYKKRIESLK